MTKRHLITVIASSWVAIAAVAAVVSYESFFNSSGKPAHASAINDPGAQVLPATQATAVAAESAKIGFHITLPGYVAGPETQLKFVTTNADEGSNHPNKLPEATLVYEPPAKPAGGSTDMLVIHEVNVPVKAPGSSAAQQVQLPAGTQYQLWAQVYQVNGSYAGAVYTFDTSKNMVAIVFPDVPGSTEPSQQAVIRMYESMK